MGRTGQTPIRVGGGFRVRAATLNLHILGLATPVAGEEGGGPQGSDPIPEKLSLVKSYQIMVADSGKALADRS